MINLSKLCHKSLIFISVFILGISGVTGQRLVDNDKVSKNVVQNHLSTEDDKDKEVTCNREDEFYLNLGTGITTTEKLRPKFSYRLGFNFAFKRKNSYLRYRIGVAAGQHFMKSHRQYLLYNPKSDTSYVMHWNAVLFDIHLGFDVVMIEDERKKFYSRFGINGGSYIHRSRKTRYFSDEQGGKMIDENYSNVGQPTYNEMLGFTFGVGYQHQLENGRSFSIAPTAMYRVSGHGGHMIIQFMAAYRFSLSK